MKKEQKRFKVVSQHGCKIMRARHSLFDGTVTPCFKSNSIIVVVGHLEEDADLVEVLGQVVLAAGLAFQTVQACCNHQEGRPKNWHPGLTFLPMPFGTS